MLRIKAYIPPAWTVRIAGDIPIVVQLILSGSQIQALPELLIAYTGCYAACLIIIMIPAAVNVDIISFNFIN